jgi:hypothetical protein
MNIYTANINPEAGIAYGYISASVLDSDLVASLMDEGSNITATMRFDWKIGTAADD